MNLQQMDAAIERLGKRGDLRRIQFVPGNDGSWHCLIYVYGGKSYGQHKNRYQAFAIAYRGVQS